MNARREQTDHVAAPVPSPGQTYHGDQAAEPLICGDVVTAISDHLALIRFATDGTIVDVNANYLQVMGYSRDEVVGNHHGMFLDPGYACSADYESFWHRLVSGDPQEAAFLRLGKHSRRVWIQATYSPIRDAHGTVTGIVKVATEVTEQKLHEARNQALLDAISRSQATVELSPDGTIIDANSNFLTALGYRFEQVRGHHHRMLCPPHVATSDQYASFWRSLAAGKAMQGEFERVTRTGHPVWIRAIYTPVLNAAGSVATIVKLATRISSTRDETETARGRETLWTQPAPTAAPTAVPR